jgi:hypothetical protein
LPTRTANEDQRYVVSPKFFIIRNKLSYISHRMTAVALGCPDALIAPTFFLDTRTWQLILNPFLSNVYCSAEEQKTP